MMQIVWKLGDLFHAVRLKPRILAAGLATTKACRIKRDSCQTCGGATTHFYMHQSRWAAGSFCHSIVFLDAVLLLHCEACALEVQ